jgi:peptidoglycan/LPS O-acetylase OafA/YrhL
VYIEKNKFKIGLLFLSILLLSILTSNYNILNEKCNYFFSKTENLSFNQYQNNNLANSNIYFEVNFNFKIKNKSHELENLFQTDNFNSGIRAEFDKDNKLWILVSDDKNNLFGIPIKDNFLADKENNLFIKFQNGILNISINENLVKNDFRNLKPKFNNIKFAQGFNDERIFSGEVYNSRVIYKNITNVKFSLILLILNIFIIIMIITELIKNDMKYDFKSKFTFNTNKYNKLLTIRSIAWIMVLVVHLYIGFNINFKEVSNKLIIKDVDMSFLIFTSPWSGVWIFFILSGFLMGKSFFTHRYDISGKGIKKFYLNRMIQIFPIYYLCIFIVSVFIHPEILKISNLENLFRLLTFTNDSELNMNINGALWSLSTEIQFYILAPFLVILMHYLSIKFNLFVIVILLSSYGILERFILFLIGGLDFQFWNIYIYKPLYSNLDLFLFGIFINILIDKIIKTNFINKYNSRISAILFYLAFIIVIFLNNYIGYQTFIVNDLEISKFFIFIMPTLTAILLIYIISYIEIKDILNNINNVKMTFTHFFGILTFPIYVWHEPILHQVNNIISTGSFFEKSIFSLLLIFIISLMMYNFIEKPMSKMKNAK